MSYNKSSNNKSENNGFDNKVSVVSLGRNQIFNFGWKFSHSADDGLELPSADDSAWRTLDLPHDWSIEDLPSEAGSELRGPFAKDAPGGTATGFALGGEGWYRKHFQLDAASPGRVEVTFEGVYMESDVWINGHHLGRRVHGYTPFGYDLTPHLNFDGDNVLAVRVRNLGRNSRWYSGSGIYRNVVLDVMPEESHVERWGVGIATRQISGGAALIDIDIRVTHPASDLSLVTRIKDAAGKVIAEATSPAIDIVKQSLTLADVQLWSPETRTLYVAETEVRRGKKIIDTVINPFGVRIVTFDAEHGMRINGTPTKLRGGCIHHDNGLLGAAAFADAEERRVLLLKARGYNAVRGSHNPFSRAFADACDKHGMLMIEEAFDMWLVGKTPHDYSNHFREHWQADLSAMVLSARNHPSIIMWSIGNEVPARSEPDGIEAGWNLANEVHRLDPTRPVTAAINGFAGRPVIADAETARAGHAGIPDESAAFYLDVVGYNYKLDRYESDHARYPQRVMYGSETYPKQIFDNWRFVDAHPYVIGDFVWTAMDYLGEAALGAVSRSDSPAPAMTMPAWPSVVSNCGDLDLTGWPKAPSYARDVIWGVSAIEMAVHRPLAAGEYEHVGFWAWPDECQSWTWPGSEDQLLSVRIYTRADKVELLLNGKVCESKVLADNLSLPIEFKVPYAPGALEAIAYRNGVEIGRRRFDTVDVATAIKVTAEQSTGCATRNSLSYVWIEVIDAQGRAIPDAVRTIELNVEGPAQLIAFGSGNPLANGSFQSPITETFDGRALAILKSEGTPGAVTVQALSDGLLAGFCTVQLVNKLSGARVAN